LGEPTALLVGPIGGEALVTAAGIAPAVAAGRVVERIGVDAAVPAGIAAGTVVTVVVDVDVEGAGMTGIIIGKQGAVVVQGVCAPTLKKITAPTAHNKPFNAFRGWLPNLRNAAPFIA
jgi:hypothetical protein